MRGIHEFIIEIKVTYNKTFKTESGLELYANKDFSADRLSNRVGKVISTPLLLESEIKEGFEVMIDPTVLYEQCYLGAKQESIFLVDREKMWFRIEPRLIILYRENKLSKWKGFLENLLVEPIKKPEPKRNIIFTIEEVEKYEKGKAKIVYPNVNIEVETNDKVAIDPSGGVPFWINGKEFWWVRNVDVLGKFELN